MTHFKILSISFSLLLFVFTFSLKGLAAQASSLDEEMRPNSLTVINYITGWAHDTFGYHPAIYMLLDNTSGKDLSHVPIRFQGKFTDLETGEVRTGRKEIRVELKPNQHIQLAIEAPYAYILPIQTYNWPLLECKVMIRVGNATDEGTETLLITKIDSITRFEEEAFQILNQSSGYDPSLVKQRQMQQRHHAAKTKNPISSKPEKTNQNLENQKPLIAKADKLNTSTNTNDGIVKQLYELQIPTLGEDFYAFEQKFGLPINTESNDLGWVLAKYQDNQLLASIIVGAKKNSSKSNLLIIELPKNNANSQSLLEFAQSLVQKTKAPISNIKKSVRYIQNGRLEITHAIVAGKQIELLKFNNLSNYDNYSFLVVFREPQNLDGLLTQISKKSQLLKLFKLWFTS
jgi:hypothetical protein